MINEDDFFKINYFCCNLISFDCFFLQASEML